MRKEIVFAITMGIVFGLIVAFGVIRANKAINKSSSQVTTSDDSGNSNSQTEVAGLAISLNQPQDIRVETENPITVSGISKPGAWIAISSEGDTYLTKTNEKGEFSQNVNLYGGLNQIVIVAVGENGDTSKKQTNIVYSTEFNQEQGGEDETSSATQEANEVENKVNQKIEEVRNRATFYTGTITDITNSTFQLKSDDGEIKQVSILDSAIFVKLGKTSTTLKLEDVAIGDYIIALGYVNDKGVLASSRILVTSPSQPNTPVITLGKVSDIKRTQVTVAPASGTKEIEIVPTNSTLTTSGKIENPKKVKFSTIENDDTILVIGVTSESEIEASRIHIISTPEPTTSQKSP